MIRVAINFDERVWGRLASVAEDRGIQIADVVTAAVLNELKPKDRRDVIVKLVRAGYPDRVIAEKTGELRQYVAEARREAGLEPNRDRHAQTDRSIAQLEGARS